MRQQRTFENISLKGASFYRAGEFKKAKAIYQNISSKEGRYNFANALVMLGEYDAAIEAYELASEDRHLILKKQKRI